MTKITPVNQSFGPAAGDTHDGKDSERSREQRQAQAEAFVRQQGGAAPEDNSGQADAFPDEAEDKFGVPEHPYGQVADQARRTVHAPKPPEPKK